MIEYFCKLSTKNWDIYENILNIWKPEQVFGWYEYSINPYHPFSFHIWIVNYLICVYRIKYTIPNNTHSYILKVKQWSNYHVSKSRPDHRYYQMSIKIDYFLSYLHLQYKWYINLLLLLFIWYMEALSIIHRYINKW